MAVWKNRRCLGLVALSYLLTTVSAICGPEELRRRQIGPGELRPSYDYIIAGGGQSGLVVASRLSEDPTKTVLVVEYGTFDNDPAQIEPPSATTYLPRNIFNVSTVRQPGLDNRTGQAWAAAVVGGGSTINGMVFNRGAAEDYDNWEKLGNSGWGWKGLFPYFRKSTTFNTPIDPQIVSQYNITWDTSAYGDGPIEVTYPPWQYPGTTLQARAFNDLGFSTQREHAAGTAYGVHWTPTCNDRNSRRSYARKRYFDPNRTRPNLHLLTWYRVNEVLFSDSESKRAEGVKIQARGTTNGAETITVRAQREIILAAGWMHTPQILQRSGIGPRVLLEQAGIPVVVDLPGVGSNLQDHPAFSGSVNLRSNVRPNPDSLTTNATFRQFANEQWRERRGPLSFGFGFYSMLQAPLPIMDPQGYQTIVNTIRQQSPASILPRTYTSAQQDGYIAQREILAASYASTTNSVLEIPFYGNTRHAFVLMKPLSRGTVLLNPTDRYAEPIVDYRTNSNPVDLSIARAAIRLYRRFISAPSLRSLRPVEVTPGSSIRTDTQMTRYITSSMSPSIGHGCCTAAMMPRELGGVVSPTLEVYGVRGLSVIDVSVIPLVPAAHTCATVYAVAEKAADVIKGRNV